MSWEDMIREVRAVSEGITRDRLMERFPKEFEGVFPAGTLPDDNWELEQFINRLNEALEKYKDRMQLAALRQFGVLS